MRHALLPGGILLHSILISAATAAQDGKPVDLTALRGWDIVVSVDASPAEQYAAEEFRTFFGKATGQVLGITQEAARPSGQVFIGAGEAMRKSAVGFDTSAFGPEEFRIIIRDGNIAIAGGRPRGTLYGVYTFLEDYVGVRFLTADHTHVPGLSSPTPTGPLDRTFKPVFGMRWSYYGENMANPAFATRLRNNTITAEPKLGGKTGQALINHSFGAQIPTARYGQEHPEYFALIDGKRIASGDDWMQTEPCLTNPDVLRIVTEAVLADLKANPARENISVSQNDNDRYCRCPNCAALDEREGTPMGSLLTFVNAVADAVAKEHPKVMVGTLSYWYTRKPPKTVRPHSNVQIQLCSIECCQLHAINDPNCPKNRQFCADMDAWGALTPNIFIWNYNTNFSNYLLPFPNLQVIEPNVRYFAEHGANGIFMQAAGNSTSAELSDLRNYVMSNLIWDPKRSATALVDEFLSLHYAQASPPIRRFINLVHDNALKSGQHPNCFGAAAAYGLDAKIAQAGLDAFAEAMKLADDDTVRMRVEKASICALRAAIEPAWLASEKGKLDPPLADAMRPHVQRFLELCAKFRVPMFSEGITTDAARQRLQAALDLQG